MLSIRANIHGDMAKDSFIPMPTCLSIAYESSESGHSASDSGVSSSSPLSLSAPLPCQPSPTVKLDPAISELIFGYENRIAQLELSYTVASLELEQVREELRVRAEVVAEGRSMCLIEDADGSGCTSDALPPNTLFDEPVANGDTTLDLASTRQALRINTRKLATSDARVVSTKSQLSSVQRQFKESESKLKGATFSLVESEAKRTVLSERVICLQSHIKVCADQSRRALEVERDLRVEIEHRVKELLDELYDLKQEKKKSCGVLGTCASPPSGSTTEVDTFRPFARHPRPASMHVPQLCATTTAQHIRRARPTSMYANSRSPLFYPTSQPTQPSARPLGRRATSEQWLSSSNDSVLPYQARQSYLKELKLGRSCSLPASDVISPPSLTSTSTLEHPAKLTWRQQTKRMSAVLALSLVKKIGKVVCGPKVERRAFVETNLCYWMDLIYEAQDDRTILTRTISTQ